MGFRRAPSRPRPPTPPLFINVLRDIGGAELVGAATELDPGVFYVGASQTPAEH